MNSKKIATTIQIKVKEIFDKPYTRRLTPDEDGGYAASVLEFPGCFADGDTADEALNNLEKVAASWLEVALANGQEIREPISFDGCSGKIALRIPRTLHMQAAQLAELESCSLNQLLTMAIAHYVGGKQLSHQITLQVNREVRFDKFASANSVKIMHGLTIEHEPTSYLSNNFFTAPMECIEYGRTE